MCLELINNIAEKTDPQTSNAFFNQFFITILQDVFFVLTDQDHKAGFKTQSMLLMRMFYFVAPADGSAPKIQGPVYQPDQAQAGTSNREFLSNFVSNLLQNAFSNLTPYVPRCYLRHREANMNILVVKLPHLSRACSR